MLDIYGEKFSKEELRKRVSSISQIAGAKVYKYENGKASGVKAVDIKTGSGMEFTILIDRGMDIGDAFYKGIPFAWKNKCGVVASEYYDNQGQEWLRSFFGGLFTTCGLTNTGAPCENGGFIQGLHGSVANIPADSFSVDEYWDGDDYCISFKGKLKQAVLYGENLTLTREIKTYLGQSKIYITDTIKNEGYVESPLMMLYHFNHPYPFVSENSKLYSSAQSIDTVLEQEDVGGDPYTMKAPIDGSSYELYGHNMPKDSDDCYNAIINEKLELGVYIKYSSKQLPCMTEWKMVAPQDYVVGIEPANCPSVGVEQAIKDKSVKMIQPGEKIVHNIEVGIVDGKEQIDELTNKITK